MTDISESAFLNLGAISFERPIFEAHMIPIGCLPRDFAAHALWNYYLCASRAEEDAADSIDEQIVLEGELWHTTHHPQLARAIAFQYGVTVQQMMANWVFVDLECDRLGLPRASSNIRNAAESA